MTEEFPTLRLGEVALSRADTNTGIVLDEDFNFALNSKQRVYTIFNNDLTALEAAKKMIVERPTVEFYIHKASDELIYLLNASGVKEF